MSARPRRRDSFGDPGLLRFDLAAIAALFLIAGITWLALAPLRIWHVTGADGQQHPDAATWAAYGSGGAVVLGAMVFFSVRSARRRGRALALRRGIDEGLEAARDAGDGFPRGDLRRAAGGEGFPRPACRHPRAVPVNDLYERRVAWLCPDPPLGCGAQLDPGARSAELTPDGSWPPIRRRP